MKTLSLIWLMFVTIVAMYWLLRNTNKYFWQGVGIGLLYVTVSVITTAAIMTVLTT